VERGVSKKSRKKRLGCNHRGFTFLAKETEIGDKKKGGKKGKPVTIGLRPVLTAHKLFFFSPKLSYVPFVLARDHGDGEISFEICETRFSTNFFPNMFNIFLSHNLDFFVV
jgi:hypothetical protein